MSSTEHIGFTTIGFVGVVEDRMDPQKLGRVRVRALGFHTERKCSGESESSDAGIGQVGPVGSTTEVAKASTARSSNCIDTEQLPWAVPAIPNVYGAMNGIGISSVGLVEGTWVYGVFLDGGHAQQPLILGVLPGRPDCAFSGGDPRQRPAEEGDTSQLGDLSENGSQGDCNILSIQSEGFFDPRSDKKLKDAPRPPKCLKLKATCEESENGGGGGGLRFTGYKGQSHNPAQKASSNGLLRQGKGEVYHTIEENDAAENFPIEGNNEYAYRTDTFKGESDYNRLARNDDEESINKTIVKWKKDNVDTRVPTASYPDTEIPPEEKERLRIPKKCDCATVPGRNPRNFKPLPPEEETQEDETTFIPGSGRTLWDEPESPYDAKYPYNHVMETESGHVEEWDDTPGAERYHRWHRAGTFTEIHPDGTRVDKVVGERYTIILTNDKVHIEANSDITIDKAAKIYVNADKQDGNHFDIEVGEGSTLNVFAPTGINVKTDKLTIDSGKEGSDELPEMVLNLKSLHVNTQEDFTMSIGGDIVQHVDGCVEQIVTGAIDITADGNYDVYVGGSDTRRVEGNSRDEIKGDYSQNIGGDSEALALGVMTEVGAPITMNPEGGPEASFKHEGGECEPDSGTNEDVPEDGDEETNEDETGEGGDDIETADLDGDGVDDSYYDPETGDYKPLSELSTTNNPPANKKSPVEESSTSDSTPPSTSTDASVRKGTSLLSKLRKNGFDVKGAKEILDEEGIPYEDTSNTSDTGTGSFSYGDTVVEDPPTTLPDGSKSARLETINKEYKEAKENIAKLEQQIKEDTATLETIDPNDSKLEAERKALEASIERKEKRLENLKKYAAEKSKEGFESQTQFGADKDERERIEEERAERAAREFLQDAILDDPPPKKSVPAKTPEEVRAARENAIEKWKEQGKTDAEIQKLLIATFGVLE